MLLEAFPFPGSASFGGSGSMARDHSFGCCGLVQGLCGLVEVFLPPPPGRPLGGFLANKPRDVCSSSSRHNRWTVSSRDVGISSGNHNSPRVARGLRFGDQVARNSTAAAADLCSSSSRGVRTGSGQENSPSAARGLRFGEQVVRSSPPAAADLCSSSSRGVSTGSGQENSPSAARGLRFNDQLARNSPAAAADLCSSSSRGVSTGPARELRFTNQEADLSPVTRNSPACVAGVVDDDDDDCVILDSDPYSAAAVQDEKEGCAGDGGSDEEELQIVGEKGKVACRDFPHSRHLCSNMPFGTTSHDKHCTMCYCFVCDIPAPCSYWGRGLSVGDHCHAKDKEIKWKMLREAFRSKNLPASHRENETAVYPAMASLGRLFLSNQISLRDFVAQSQHIHTSVRASLNGGQTVSVPREGSGTSNAHTAQVTRPTEQTVSAPRAHPVAGAGRGTSNTHTTQVTWSMEQNFMAPRAHPAAEAGRGTSNTHTAQISHPLTPAVGAPRACSVTGVRSGTSNAHSAQVSHLAVPTVTAPRPHPAAGAGRGTSSTQTALITRPAEQTVSAPRLHPVARASSNAHSAQIAYPATTNGYLPELDAPEGATVYVGNLPYHIDNERLKRSFQHAGVVLSSKVIYNRETGQSRGFAYVTMDTVQEAEKAVRMYHGSEIYGRPLTVNIAAPRGGTRVEATRRQSDSTLRIFVCNLPSQVNRFQLEELFSKHGKVVDARVVYERREGALCSRGFGFVTMATEEESHNAIRALNKQILEGNPLGVKVARERPERGCLSPGNQNAVSQNQHANTSVRASPNVASTVSAPRVYPAARAGGSTSNASTSQVTHRLDPTVSAPRPGQYRVIPPTS